MKKLTWSILLLLSTFQVKAQAYLGVGSSNYAGALGNIVNPASFVDGRQKMDLALLFRVDYSGKHLTAEIHGMSLLQ